MDYTHRSFRADGCQANWLQKWLVAQGSHMAHCMSYTDSLQSALFSILVWAPLAPQSYWPVSKTANCTVKMRGFFKRWRESITFVSFPNSVMLCDLPLESILQSFKSQLQFLIWDESYNFIPTGWILKSCRDRLGIHTFWVSSRHYHSWRVAKCWRWLKPAEDSHS